MEDSLVIWIEILMVNGKGNGERGKRGATQRTQEEGVGIVRWHV